MVLGAAAAGAAPGFAAWAGIEKHAAMNAASATRWSVFMRRDTATVVPGRKRVASLSAVAQ